MLRLSSPFLTGTFFFSIKRKKKDADLILSQAQHGESVFFFKKTVKFSVNVSISPEKSLQFPFLFINVKKPLIILPNWLEVFIEIHTVFVTSHQTVIEFKYTKESPRAKIQRI